ncbi:MAG: polysaccharide deacetylase family protein [Clostridia bacterium]|nr:polysaccharide deacetylase family protein [Clostridia bacterium]
MKIIIWKKKVLFMIVFTFFLVFSIYLSFYHPFSMAIELSSHSAINDGLKEKIDALNKEKEKVAYLTFDDGPTQKATPKILDVLKEEEVKATFFVIGKYVAHHPALVKRAYEEGHFIANHGYDHNNQKLYASKESFIHEVKSTDEEISKAIGVNDYCSHIFRFPNGYMSPNNKSQKKKCAKLLEDMNYTYVDWNCLNHDSIKKYSSQQLLDNLKKSSKNKRNFSYFNA